MQTMKLFRFCAVTSFSLSLFLYTFASHAPGLAQDRGSAPNTLTQEEKAAGWRLLFDGKTTEGWRGFKKPGFPGQGWAVEGGCLMLKMGQARGGDLITVDRFQNFELSFEWRAVPKANSGVKYLILEDKAKAVGHEYQIMDQGPSARQVTGALYDLIPAPNGKLPPPGQFNSGRIVVRGRHGEHWLNGVKLLEYEMGSPEMKQAIAKSKFKDVPGFGMPVQGHILLQDHGSDICFRSIKIREIPAP